MNANPQLSTNIPSPLSEQERALALLKQQVTTEDIQTAGVAANVRKNALRATVVYLVVAVTAFLGELFLALESGTWQTYAGSEVY